MSQHSKMKPATAKIPTKFQRCFRCGYSWPHNDSKCPAEGQKCNNCSKYNHFASVCNSKDKIREQLNQDSTHAMIFDRHIPITTVTAAVTKAPTATRVQNQPNTRKKQRSFNANLKIGKSTIPFQIDRGSSVNIIDETTFQRIKKNNPNIVLRKSRKRLFGFGSQTPLPLAGQLECVLESKKRITSARIVVVKGTTGCLLSGQTSIDLNFLTVKVNNVKTKSTFTKLASQEKVSPRLKPMVTKYDKVFHGVGKLTDVQVHLHINKEIKPVVQPTHRIPFAIRKKVESELLRLQKEDIIEPAKGPSLWISPIVAFPKPNKRLD